MSFDRDTLARRVAEFDRRTRDGDGRKAAAVAVVVIETESGPGIILTKRPETMRAHPGQWALPGGRVDPGETVTGAAIRELAEELGVQVRRDSVLGMLDDFPTRSGYLITPVVMWAGAVTGGITPNPAEVAEVHVATTEILDIEPRFITIAESPRPVIQLRMFGDWIHAPTAAVVHQFRELALHDRTTRVDEFEQPVFAWQ